MSFSNRKTNRKLLAQHLETDITWLQKVYAYAPDDLDGESPVCTVETWPTITEIKTNPTKDYCYLVTIWVLEKNARGEVSDPSAAADLIDDFHHDLCVLLRERLNAEFFQPPDLFPFSMESGNIYITETHYVKVIGL
jgi:hypothetical protein